MWHIIPNRTTEDLNDFQSLYSKGCSKDRFKSGKKKRITYIKSAFVRYDTTFTLSLNLKLSTRKIYLKGFLSVSDMPIKIIRNVGLT